MIRPLLVMGGMIALEGLVVLHWFHLPGNRVLAAIAMTAGIVMCGMALLALLSMLAVVRKDPSQPQQRRELADLGVIEPTWLGMTAVQIAFAAAAWQAGVYWMAAALLLGQGSEIAAVIHARRRSRNEQPGA